MAKEPTLIKGGKFQDHRGTLSFFNELDLNGVKRVHQLEHPNTEIFRGWQGHKIERKWFLATEGAFEIFVVKPDSWIAPSKDLLVQKYTVSVKNNQVLQVPRGFATAFKATIPYSKLLVFSSFSLEESLLDDYRFPQEQWSLP